MKCIGFISLGRVSRDWGSFINLFRFWLPASFGVRVVGYCIIPWRVKLHMPANKRGGEPKDWKKRHDFAKRILASKESVDFVNYACCVPVWVP